MMVDKPNGIIQYFSGFIDQLVCACLSCRKIWWSRIRCVFIKNNTLDFSFVITADATPGLAVCYIAYAAIKNHGTGIANLYLLTVKP
ncbi:MAG: hypothetical protein ACI8VC_002725 [Candidatus Endobugula sp.]|jgi:hypothetical protein